MNAQIALAAEGDAEAAKRMIEGFGDAGGLPLAPLPGTRNEWNQLRIVLLLLRAGLAAGLAKTFLLGAWNDCNPQVTVGDL